MADNSIPPLVEALRARLAAVEEEEANERAQHLQTLVIAKGHERRVAALADERMDLERQLARYAQEPDSNIRPGPTEAIRRVLLAQTDHVMSYEDLLQRVISEIESGNVATRSTSDPRKLVTATIANMILSRRIQRHPDGKLVRLTEG